jgi:hypothetical protein
MAKINKILWDDLIAPQWEKDIEKQIEEEVDINWDSIAAQWLGPTDPLFAVPDVPQNPEPEYSFSDPEYDKIQSMPYNEFDQYWEEKMRAQRKGVNGGVKRRPVSAGP